MGVTVPATVMARVWLEVQGGRRGTRGEAGRGRRRQWEHTQDLKTWRGQARYKFKCA